jgi:hypothetical protein
VALDAIDDILIRDIEAISGDGADLIAADSGSATELVIDDTAVLNRQDLVAAVRLAGRIGGHLGGHVAGCVGGHVGSRVVADRSEEILKSLPTNRSSAGGKVFEHLEVAAGCTRTRLKKLGVGPEQPPGDAAWDMVGDLADRGAGGDLGALLEARMLLHALREIERAAPSAPPAPPDRSGGRSWWDRATRATWHAIVKVPGALVGRDE